MSAGPRGGGQGGGDPQKWEGAPKIKAHRQQGLWVQELVALRLPTLNHTPCELEALLACGPPFPPPIQFCSLHLGKEVKVLGDGTELVAAGVWESLRGVCCKQEPPRPHPKSPHMHTRDTYKTCCPGGEGRGRLCFLRSCLM